MAFEQPFAGSSFEIPKVSEAALDIVGDEIGASGIYSWIMRTRQAMRTDQPPLADFCNVAFRPEGDEYDRVDIGDAAAGILFTDLGFYRAIQVQGEMSPQTPLPVVTPAARDITVEGLWRAAVVHREEAQWLETVGRLFADQQPVLSEQLEKSLAILRAGYGVDTEREARLNALAAYAALDTQVKLNQGSSRQLPSFERFPRPPEVSDETLKRYQKAEELFGKTAWADYIYHEMAATQNALTAVLEQVTDDIADKFVAQQVRIAGLTIFGLLHSQLRVPSHNDQGQGDLPRSAHLATVDTDTIEMIQQSQAEAGSTADGKPVWELRVMQALAQEQRQLAVRIAHTLSLHKIMLDPKAAARAHSTSLMVYAALHNQAEKEWFERLYDAP